jgi:hypothetical protein
MRGDRAIAPDVVTPFMFPTPAGGLRPIQHPPGHPRCRCAAVLLPPAMSEDAVRRLVTPDLPDCGR